MQPTFQPIYLKIYKKSLSEKQATIQTKTVALVYGFVFIGLAFLAQFLGGVLQAALTIFGVVGGPLLGLFTLGMFTVMANQKVSIDSVESRKVSSSTLLI